MLTQRQGAELADSRPLFELALGPANQTSVVIWGGGARGFVALSRLYEAWQAWRVTMSAVVPPSVQGFLPSSIHTAALPTRDRQLSASEAWALTHAAGLILIGPDMQLTSADQTLLARLLPEITQPIVCTDEALNLWRVDPALHHHSNISLVASVENLLRVQRLSKVEQRRLAARGMYGVAEQLASISSEAPYLCAYADDAVYVYVREADTLLFAQHALTREQIRVLVLALLPITLFARTARVEGLDRVRVLLACIAGLNSEEATDGQVWPKVIRRKLS